MNANVNIKSWQNVASEVETLSPAEGLAQLHNNSLASICDGSPWVARIIADSLLNTFVRLAPSQAKQREVTETMRAELRGLNDSYSGSEVQQNRIDALQARVNERDSTASILAVLEADALQLYTAVTGENWTPMTKAKADALRREREAKAKAREVYRQALENLRTAGTTPVTPPQKVSWFKRIFG